VHSSAVLHHHLLDTSKPPSSLLFVLLSVLLICLPIAFPLLVWHTRGPGAADSEELVGLIVGEVLQNVIKVEFVVSLDLVLVIAITFPAARHDNP
jgi:hypothetical protein